VTTSIVNIGEVFRFGPRSGRAPKDLALQALERGDFEAAEQRFTALLEPGGAVASAERAFLLNKRGVARAGLGRREAARADFAEALETEPCYAPALTNVGNQLLEAGDLDAAIAKYEAAIAADAEYAVAFLNLGIAYKRAGRIADGVRALRRARSLESRASATAWRRPRLT
jgi:tetratricopeptide (TPR) repeat protein